MRARVAESVRWFGPSRALAAVAGVLVVVIGAWWVVRVPPPPIDDRLPRASATSVETTETLRFLIVVHVTGAVRSPGVFRLAPDSRVVDAVAAAGGTTAQADTVAVNFAAGLVDGAQVFIPLRGRVSTTTLARPKPGVNPPPPPTSLGVLPATPSPTPTQQTGPIVNLNTASLAELDSLPGIGPSTAQAIIDYRVVKGRFKSVDDLLNVRGIGEAKLAAIRSRVAV